MDLVKSLRYSILAGGITAGIILTKSAQIALLIADHQLKKNLSNTQERLQQALAPTPDQEQLE